MSDNLKLCPFCPDGGAPELIEWPDRLAKNDIFQYWITCQQCGITTKKVWSKQEVLNSWNTRSK